MKKNLREFDGSDFFHVLLVFSFEQMIRQNIQEQTRPKYFFPLLGLVADLNIPIDSEISSPDFSSESNIPARNDMLPPVMELGAAFELNDNTTRFAFTYFFATQLIFFSAYLRKL